MAPDKGKDKPPRQAKEPAKPSPSPQMARRLRERFQLIEEVGRGGLSRVYKARDMVAIRAGLSDPYVALKIIGAGQKTDPDLIALMHREARRLRDLVHPNIVRVYDMDADGRFHYMVLEYLAGQPLSRILRHAEDHRIPLAQIDQFLADITAALSFSHQNGIIHADLKPGNIFVQTSGRVKLIDFNIAYPVARPMRTKEEDTIAILGRLGALTPIYASPQRLAGAEPSSGDDVFSLGVIIYLALTGKRPFGEKDAAQAREAGLVPQRPDGLSNRRWRALKNALAWNDDQRTPSIEGFARDFSDRPWYQSWFAIADRRR